VTFFMTRVSCITIPVSMPTSSRVRYHSGSDDLLGQERKNSEWPADPSYETVMVPFIVWGWYSQCQPIPWVRFSVTVLVSPPSTS